MKTKDEEFLVRLHHHLRTSPGDTEDAREAYGMTLRHVLSIINPRDSARGIIFALEQRLKELDYRHD